MPGDLVLVDPSTIVNHVGDVLVDEERFSTYIKVPEGHVWVTGDNLSHSLDSRTYNALPMGLIMGRLWQLTILISHSGTQDTIFGGLNGSKTPLWMQMVRAIDLF